MLYFRYREPLCYFTSIAVIGMCSPQGQNRQASAHGLRGNGNYLLEAHSYQYMHHVSTHYSIQVTLPPTLLGELEHRNTIHTRLWLLSATARRGCISWNNWILLLLRAEQNNAWRDANPTVCCHLKRKYICFLLIHWVLKTPLPIPISPCLSQCPLCRALLSLLPPTVLSSLE